MTKRAHFIPLTVSTDTEATSAAHAWQVGWRHGRANGMSVRQAAALAWRLRRAWRRAEARRVAEREGRTLDALKLRKAQEREREGLKRAAAAARKKTQAALFRRNRERDE